MLKLIPIVFLSVLFSVISIGCQRSDDLDFKKPPTEDTTTPHSLNSDGVNASPNLQENNKADYDSSSPIIDEKVK